MDHQTQMSRHSTIEGEDDKNNLFGSQITFLYQITVGKKVSINLFYFKKAIKDHSL